MILIVNEIRIHHHKTIEIKSSICTICQQKSDLKLHLYQKYIWNILLLGPVIPSIKFGVLECSTCQKNIPNRSWNPEIKSIYSKEKALLKTPLRFWRGGAILMCMLVGFALYGAKAVRKGRMFRNVEKYSKNIAKDDILIVCDSTNFHGINQNKIMKIQKIEGNKVYLVLYADRVSWEEQSEVDKDNLDPDKFGKNVLVVSLDYLKKKQYLMKFDKNGQEEAMPCGGINGIIK